MTVTATSYIDSLVSVLGEAPDRTVLRSAGAGTTGAELLAAIYRYARVLDAQGLRPGDLVALLAPNRPEALALRYAAHLIGAAAVYLSAPPSAQTRSRMIAQFDPRLVVVFPGTVSLLPGDVTAPVAAIGPVPGVPLRLDQLAAAQPAQPLAPRAQPGDLAVVISSGGTTGVPKGSRRDFTTYSTNVLVPAPAPGRRQLANGKLAYLTQILVDQTLLGGGTVILQDHYEPAATLDAIERERITHLFLVEPQLFGLMDDPAVPSRDLSSLRVASEIGIVSALSPAEHDRPSRFGCAGRIQPGVDVRFRSPDGTLDPRTGSIEVRSPAMALGYRHRPAEEAQNFADGWYRTGDLGALDGEDMLQILGRAVDIRDTGISPVALQDTLCQQPSVRYAVLVADPDRGGWIAAAQPWPGGAVDPGQCRAAVAGRHGPAAAASLQLMPVDQIPLTEQGKPNRPAIRAAALAGGRA
jgi:fatty-acyl-CoA synthase